MQVKAALEQIFDSETLMKETYQMFNEMIQLSDSLANEITVLLEKKAMNQEIPSLDVAMVALARTLMYLSRLYYESDEAFTTDIEVARDIMYERVSIAIDHPQRCQTCSGCQTDGLCEQPIIDERVSFQLIPLISASLIEYSQWCQFVNEATSNPK